MRVVHRKSWPTSGRVYVYRNDPSNRADINPSFFSVTSNFVYGLCVYRGVKHFYCLNSPEKFLPHWVNCVGGANLGAFVGLLYSGV